ncbi:hypothetical protein Tco_0967383 [Tanacetum coccineum]
MRTRSQSREQHPPPPEEPPVVIEPLRIEYPFQEDPPVEPMADTENLVNWLLAHTEGILAMRSPDFSKVRMNRLWRLGWIASLIYLGMSTPWIFRNCINFVTFYNALNINDQDSLNSAEVDTFWTKMPQRMFKINREHVQGFCSEHCSLTRRTKASAPATAPVKSKLRSGTLPGNTVTNPREDLKGITTRSGVAYQGPPIPTSSVVKPIPEVTKDQVHPSCSQSTAPSQLGKSALVNVLKSTAEALDWKLSDIQWYQPGKFCTTRFSMDEDYCTKQSNIKKSKFQKSTMSIKKEVKKLLKLD